MATGKTTKVNGIHQREGTTPGGRQYVSTKFADTGRKITVVGRGKSVAKGGTGRRGGENYVKDTRAGASNKVRQGVGKSGDLLYERPTKKGPTKPAGKKKGGK